jgi:putative transcriptional regulator
MTSVLVIDGCVKYAFHMESRVRELRLQQSLSQQALATAMGVSRQTINAIETGRYDPSLTLAVHLARHFETTVEELFDVDA